MACLTRAAEKNRNHPRALGHVFHPDPAGPGTPAWMSPWAAQPCPRICPPSPFLFLFGAAFGSCDAAELVFGTMEPGAHFRALVLCNINNNHWCKRRWLQLNTEGFIQPLHVFFLVYTFPCPRNFQWTSQVAKVRSKQRRSEVESRAGSMTSD